ncbi:8224_t:CDS:2 [Cetraspora pellucida]|uniref:8224_t:CDS:1 n=1 Tax=Cetraspora pellucida TaxID=1433469 RepID=A0ACA9MYK0_9GLOM|nr:8224_t:CDS:2 [Cetraspora pellucida]
MSDKVSNAVQKLWTSYSKNTPQSLQLIDAYLVFILFSGVIQFVHCVLVGTYPYNAFLAGFISTVGSFVLAAQGHRHKLRNDGAVNVFSLRRTRCGTIRYVGYDGEELKSIHSSDRKHSDRGYNEIYLGSSECCQEKT